MEEFSFGHLLQVCARVCVCVCVYVKGEGGGGGTEIRHPGAGDFVIVTINRCFSWQFYTKYLIRYISLNSI